MATIDFTGRGAPEIPAFSTTPVTVTRDVSADAPAPAENVLARAETDVTATSTSTPHSSSIPEQGAPKAPDPDEVYEQVMTRLRRDLIAELEQNGHLLRDTF
jgi:hypothetical protein